MKQPTSNSQDTRSKTHFRPVWITSALLLATLTVTFFYFKDIESPGFFPGNILVLTLIELNLILLVLLVLLLSRNLIKHYFERRRKIPGAGFRGKLIAAFVGFSSVPAILLLVVASGLLTSSVENWFSIQVEKPLDDALRVAQLYYEKEEKSARDRAEKLTAMALSRGLSDGSETDPLKWFLDSKRKEYGVAGLEWIPRTGLPPIRSIDPDIAAGAFTPPSQELLRRAFSGETVVEKPVTTEGNLVRAIAPVRSSAGSVDAVMAVDMMIPEELEENMQAISRSFEDYRQLKAFKNPIKESYLLSFVLITMVILFSATWFGFYLAKSITIPIQQLADGTRAVAQGDLSFRIRVRASDELGVLVKSFNKMTEDLQVGKNQLEEVNRSLLQSNLELDQRRNYIETVLRNIATGMISLDPEGRITAVNYSAERIFKTSHQEVAGKLIHDAFGALKLTPLLNLFEELEERSLPSIEREVHLEVEGRALTLHVNLTRIRSDQGTDLGKVMVVEDLTELIKAEKAAAWQEVAQHIAHEIKNPLTPIQLSTQRLRKKFQESAADFPEVLDQSTATIMNEVQSLKRLVDEFSQFARLPAPSFTEQDLHGIILEVAQLYRTAHRNVTIETRFDPSLTAVHVDRDQIRRVFVNLFENAVEAMKHQGNIRVTTALRAEDRKAVIEVEDDGSGILPEDQDKVFLPYFSRKKTGTGLGLAIVHRIIREHNGNISLSSRTPNGTRIVLELPA